MVVCSFDALMRGSSTVSRRRSRRSLKRRIRQLQSRAPWLVSQENRVQRHRAKASLLVDAERPNEPSQRIGVPTGIDGVVDALLDRRR